MTNGQYFVNNGDSYKKRDQGYEKDSGISLELTKICNAKDYKEYVSKNKKITKSIYTRTNRTRLPLEWF